MTTLDTLERRPLMNWEMMWSYLLRMEMDQASWGVVPSRDSIQLWILESPVGNIYEAGHEISNNAAFGQV